MAARRNDDAPAASRVALVVRVAIASRVVTLALALVW